MVFIKISAKSFPEILGNRGSIPENETSDIFEEFPMGNSREVSFPGQRNRKLSRIGESSENIYFSGYIFLLKLEIVLAY